MKPRLPFQLLYDLGALLWRGSRHPSRAVRSLARLGRLAARPLMLLLPPGAIVSARVWSTRLLMRADHHLPGIVSANPFWSQSLVHVVTAVGKSPVRVVDVGANIGDTVALLESGGVACEYLCVEADEAFFELCAENTKAARPRVDLVRCFVGDRPGSAVVIDHREPGTATTRLVDGESAPAGSSERAMPLDRVCSDFAKRGGIDVIKIDTDGFDFKVLRSGEGAIRAWKPALFFEWDPRLWEAQGEDPLAVFDYLGDLGYSHFSFFADNGFHYADVELPASVTLHSLRGASLARVGIDNLYFDVLAARPDICRRAVEVNVQGIRALRRRVPNWTRLAPSWKV